MTSFTKSSALARTIHSSLGLLYASPVFSLDFAITISLIEIKTPSSF